MRTLVKLVCPTLCLCVAVCTAEGAAKKSRPKPRMGRIRPSTDPTLPRVVPRMPKYRTSTDPTIEPIKVRRRPSRGYGAL